MMDGWSFDRVRMFAERERLGVTLEQIGVRLSLGKYPKQCAWRYESGLRRPGGRARRKIELFFGLPAYSMNIRKAALAERVEVLDEWLLGDRSVPFYIVMNEKFGRPE